MYKFDAMLCWCTVTFEVSFSEVLFYCDKFVTSHPEWALYRCLLSRHTWWLYSMAWVCPCHAKLFHHNRYLSARSQYRVEVVKFTFHCLPSLISQCLRQRVGQISLVSTSLELVKNLETVSLLRYFHCRLLNLLRLSLKTQDHPIWTFPSRRRFFEMGPNQ